MEGTPCEGVMCGSVRKALFVAVTFLALFLAAQTVSVVMGWHYIGAGLSSSNTIQVTGHGEASATPDVGTFTFTVSSKKMTVSDAQKDQAAKINAVTEYLKGAGIDVKDIKTSDYSVYPQYDYSQSVCPLSEVKGGAPVYCPPGKQTLAGYLASQSTTVKVRNLEKAGDIISGVGTKGATEVGQLAFGFDNPEAVQKDARSKAIADAKTKADELAKELGVSLVRVVSFAENGGGYPRMMYGATADSMQKATTPEISPGETKVTNDVTISYEIR